MRHEGPRGGDGSSRGDSCPGLLPYQNHGGASCTSLVGEERSSSACSSVAVVGPGAGPAGAAAHAVLRLPAPPLKESRHRWRSATHRRDGADTSCSGAHFPSVVDLFLRERLLTRSLKPKGSLMPV
ncbi:hypothetical protein HPB50_016207 [Hyalomma asiaticum]|uniref:Uncharacterized protein n=1 Tax=Hyalomma asiaticum TaxID=266040 RepID=A0ACB7SNZ1_HYAAI|nr:hypothetical protein HPB50_016207 [Hyalomma asiaticum]